MVQLPPFKDKDVEKLQHLQRSAGRRVQRFPKRSPACSSYYGLGWIHIKTYIQVKKLLFLLTLICIDKEKKIHRIFIERIKVYLNNGKEGLDHVYNSPIFEPLDTSAKCSRNGIGSHPLQYKK